MSQKDPWAEYEVKPDPWAQFETGGSKTKIPGVSSVTAKGPVTEYAIEATGKTLPLPTAMPESRVRSLIDGHIRAATRGPQPQSQAPQGPDERTAGQVAFGQFENVGQGVKNLPKTLYGGAQGAGALIMKALLAAGRDPNAAKTLPQDILAMLKGTKDQAMVLPRGAGAVAESVGMLPPNTVTEPTRQEFEGAAQGAGQNLATVAGGALAQKVVGAIPSQARAQAKFNTVAQQANPVPVNLTSADAVIARAQELGTRGSVQPKVVRDFVKNRQQGVPMTYEEARDFAINAGRLSVKEKKKIDGQMKHQVREFSKAMKEANRDAAESVGMGKLYDEAMTEYRRASNLKDATDIIKKYGARAALFAGLGAAGAAGVGLYQRFSN